MTMNLDSEALVSALENAVHAFEVTPNEANEKRMMRARATLLAALPTTAPAAGVGLDLADDNDGKEQDAFEAWAETERFDMEQHPLHWLFLDAKTAAARKGWRAGIRYARERALVSPTVDGWRPIETAWTAVAGERNRQITAEGWTAAHDDKHTDGSLLDVAVLYLWHGTDKAARVNGADGAPVGFPWAHKWWKPRDRESNLVRAGALCLAERERCLRAGRTTGPADFKLGIVLRELCALPPAPPSLQPVPVEPEEA